MNQPELDFTGQGPGQCDTSRAAHKKALTHAASDRGIIFRHIKAQGERGSTDDEGEVATGIRNQTYTPRRGELVKSGMIVWNGEKRLTRSGSPARVWIVNPNT